MRTLIKLRKSSFLMLLIVSLTFAISSNLVFANETKANVMNISGGILNKDYTYNNNILNIKTNTPLTISGNTSDTIVVDKSIKANIIFDNLNINSNNRAVDIDGASVKLTLKGSNTLKTPDYKAAIFCPIGSELTIEGDGILTATIGNRGGAAAIGGESGEGTSAYYPQFRNWKVDSATCGKITINSGIINANCPVEAINGNADTGLAIGGQKGGPITINGGKITAIGGQNTVGIGFFSDETEGIFITEGEVTAKVERGDPLNDMGANTSYGPPIGLQNCSANSKAKIVISGGTVNAVSGHYGSSGIGGARNSSGGIITITGNANVTAKGGYGAAGIGAGYAQNGGGNSCDITIDGNAIVNATGGINAPGIGSGAPRNMNAPNTGNTGIITIAGNADVTAKGGQNALGIGSGASTATGLKFPDSCKVTKVVITDNAKVNAIVGPGILPAVNPTQSERFEEYICTVENVEAIEAQNYLILDKNGNYIVKGKISLTKDLTVPEGKIIIIPENSILNVPEGVTFTYPANSDIAGEITGDGNIIKDGESSLQPSSIILKTDKTEYIYGEIIDLEATITKNEKIKKDNFNEITFYNEDKFIVSQTVIDNKVALNIDTKDLGTGNIKLKAKFSGNDIFENSFSEINIIVNKAGLAAPTNLQLVDTKALWDNVINSSKYELQIFKNNILLDTVNSDIPEYDFSKHMIDKGKYYFTVKAIGNNNYNDSTMAQSKIYNYLYYPEEELKEAIDRANQIINKEDVVVNEMLQELYNLSNAITEYNSNID